MIPEILLAFLVLNGLWLFVVLFVQYVSYGNEPSDALRAMGAWSIMTMVGLCAPMALAVAIAWVVVS